MNKKIGFIGLGLIGGSVAKAIRQYHPDYTITAFDKQRESLALAMQEGTIDSSCNTIDQNFQDCDYIFLCAPVASNNAYLRQLSQIISRDCILTDVGSVKTPIHEAIKDADLEACFIGGHPMTGSEKSGYANSKALLLENSYYILTPSSKVPAEAVEHLEALVLSLKAIPMVLSDYREHDYVTGTISHLPHVIASTLVNYVKKTDTSDELMRSLAAGGFKDITRIASSSPTMWEQICKVNEAQITPILDGYIESLKEARDAIAAGDGNYIYNQFDSSRNYRDNMPTSSAGPIKKQFALYCDIVDEAGGIATIATILASNNISIKNIGIIHNREFEEGVLRIEFYQETAEDKAAELLQKYHYIVYKR